MSTRQWTQWVVILGMVLMISGVAGADNPTRLAAGELHACLQANGKVFCWGYNGYGQLGDGTEYDRSAPVQVKDLTTAVAVAAGKKHTCAVIDDGSVKCWGNNYSGQLGDGNYNKSVPVPVPVKNLASAVGVAAGAYHSCALITGGSVKCWGYNGEGQLGDGTKKTTSTPVPVNGVANAVGVAAGAYHSCALITGGSVKCWGNNGKGQLGDGTKNNSITPVTVKDLTDAVAVAAGYDHTCALIKDGWVKCWGYNNVGQLGPVFVLMKDDMFAASTGGSSENQAPLACPADQASVATPKTPDASTQKCVAVTDPTADNTCPTGQVLMDVNMCVASTASVSDNSCPIGQTMQSVQKCGVAMTPPNADGSCPEGPLFQRSCRKKIK